MSRSYKHYPGGGITKARSEKRDKRIANRKLRREQENGLIRAQEDDNLDGLMLPKLREVSDVWGMEKDGKIYWPHPGFDPDKWDIIMAELKGTTPEQEHEKDIKFWKQFMRK